MFVTIWMCTQEWSLISIRVTAFTFATCHQAFSWSSRLTRPITRRSFSLRRTGTLIRIRATASAGVSRASRSASAGIGPIDRLRRLVSSSPRAEHTPGRFVALRRMWHESCYARRIRFGSSSPTTFAAAA